MSFILLVEQIAPDTPSTNQVVFYPKSDGLLYSKNDTGAENLVSFGAGGTITGDLTITGDVTTTTGSFVETEGAAVVAASTTNIWALDGNTIHVTGNTTITSFGTAPQAGAWMKVIFDGTPLLTQGANLNLNAGGANIQIAADDLALIYADTTTQMDVFVFHKAGTSNVFGPVATQADQEAASSLVTAVTPGRQHFHPGHPKCWAYVTVSGGTPTLQTSYNITSITDSGVGLLTFTIANDFSTANWAAVFDVIDTATLNDTVEFAGWSNVNSKAAGSTLLAYARANVDVGGTNQIQNTMTDPTAWNFAGFGDI